MDWWSGTECTLYTDPKMYPLYGNENGIVVLNHQFEIDFMCGWSFCERFGVLGVREENNISQRMKDLVHQGTPTSWTSTINYHFFPELKSLS